MKKVIPTLVVMTGLFLTVPAFGHARWLPDGPLQVRDTNPGIKTGPCGPKDRSTTPTTLQAGDTITVEWEETVQHPGRYIISFSLANDADFEELKTIEDTQDSRDDLPYSYSTTITVPNSNCPKCTLQLIQVMTENPDNPRNY